MTHVVITNYLHYLLHKWVRFRRFPSLHQLLCIFLRIPFGYGIYSSFPNNLHRRIGYIYWKQLCKYNEMWTHDKGPYLKVVGRIELQEHTKNFKFTFLSELPKKYLPFLRATVKDVRVKINNRIAVNCFIFTAENMGNFSREIYFADCQED